MDALNFSICLDNLMSDLWYPLSPEFNVFQLDRPFKVSDNVAITKPRIATLSAWLEEEDEELLEVV